MSLNDFEHYYFWGSDEKDFGKGSLQQLVLVANVKIPDLEWEPCLFKDPCSIPLDSSKVSQFTDVRNLSTAL